MQADKATVVSSDTKELVKEMLKPKWDELIATIPGPKDDWCKGCHLKRGIWKSGLCGYCETNGVKPLVELPPPQWMSVGEPIQPAVKSLQIRSAIPLDVQWDFDSGHLTLTISPKSDSKPTALYRSVM